MNNPPKSFVWLLIFEAMLIFWVSFQFVNWNVAQCFTRPSATNVTTPEGVAVVDAMTNLLYCVQGFYCLVN